MARPVILLVSVLLGAACEPPPKCLRGHEEQRWIPEFCYPVQIGSIPFDKDLSVPIYGTECDPPHWKTVFICDQLEVEREK